MNTAEESTINEVLAEEAELHYLTWFKQNADFGPADSDVHSMMDDDYTKETGKEVPKDWRQE